MKTEAKQILIIEDDNAINAMLFESLTKAGYACVQAYSGTEGKLHIEQNVFHLILLDLMIPGMTGEVLLEVIRTKTSTPVIILSAKDDIDGKVNLLTLGADDYMTKPFNIKELLARITVQLRKVNPIDKESTLSYKGLVLDKNLYIINLNHCDIPLTKHEFKILELLISYPNKVFSKQEIYNYAWDDIFIGEDKTINVHISNIRNKLKNVSSEEYIETVWGVGFRLTK